LGIAVLQFDRKACENLEHPALLCEVWREHRFCMHLKQVEQCSCYGLFAVFWKDETMRLVQVEDGAQTIREWLFCSLVGKHMRIKVHFLRVGDGRFDM